MRRLGFGLSAVASSDAHCRFTDGASVTSQCVVNKMVIVNVYSALQENLTEALSTLH